MNTYKRISQILPRVVGAKFFSILLAGLCFSLVSCDESSVVGLDVQPANDLLNVGWQDTTTLVTKTYEEDSLRTDQGLILNGEALLGKYNDPVFGVTSASLYTGIRLPGSFPDLGEHPVMLPTDYVVLSMVYDPIYYGRRLRVDQNINVYQLTGDLVSGQKYYDNNSVAISTLDLAADQTVHLDPLATQVIAGTTLKPQLNVLLNNNFGQAILNSRSLNPENFASEPAFNSFIKGLYITTENTPPLPLGTDQGNIMRFLMNDAQSKITIHYHAWTIVKGVSVFTDREYDLALSSVIRFSHFAHQYNAPGVNNALQAQLGLTAPLPASDDTLTFIQSVDGLKTKIEMPYLMRWNDKGLISVNKAELVIKADPASAYQLDTFAAPVNLVVFGINDDGTNFALPDAFEGSNYYGGAYDPTTKEYHFNIERYIQQVLNGTHANNGLHLVAASGAVNANRVVVGGGNKSIWQMKLNITYTKIH